MHQFKSLCYNNHNYAIKIIGFERSLWENIYVNLNIFELNFHNLIRSNSYKIVKSCKVESNNLDDQLIEMHI